MTIIRFDNFSNQDIDTLKKHRNQYPITH